jgi:TRAP-type C4-dicarboxylate transport system permease small subunit
LSRQLAGLTLSQVLGRLFGIVVPDAGDIAGDCMAGATFLALAHTLRSGGHIRVNLLLTHVPRRMRVVLEVWCVLFLCVVDACSPASRSTGRSISPRSGMCRPA